MGWKRIGVATAAVEPPNLNYTYISSCEIQSNFQENSSFQ